jgi:hypothetical protein
MTQSRLFPLPPVEAPVSVSPPSPARHFGDERKPFKAYKPTDVLQVWHNCDVEWTEWTGIVTKPNGTIQLAIGVTVTHRGHKTLELSGGSLDKPVRHKLGSTGFRVIHNRQTIINEQTQLDAQKRIPTP